MPTRIVAIACLIAFAGCQRSAPKQADSATAEAAAALPETPQQLWDLAEQARAGQQWKTLDETLKKLIELQPENHLAVRLAAHNLSFGLGEQQSDVAERCRFTRLAIKTLIDGFERDRHPAQAREVGRYLSMRVARAADTEAIALFVEDQALQEQLGRHVDLARAREHDGAIHPLLVARLWFEKALELFDEDPQKWDDDSKLLARADPALSLSLYAVSITSQDEDEQATRQAWKAAELAWLQLTEIDFEIDGKTQKLSGADRLREQRDSHQAELKRLRPSLSVDLFKAESERLTDAQREAMALDEAQRTEEQIKLVNAANRQLKQPSIESLEQVVAEDENRSKLIEHFREAQRLDEQLVHLMKARDVINLDNWLQRCIAEQTEEVRLARKAFGDAARLMEKPGGESENVANARLLQGFAKWAAVFRARPELSSNDLICDELRKSIRFYQVRFLDGKPLSPQFPLADLAARPEADVEMDLRRLWPSAPSAPQ